MASIVAGSAQLQVRVEFPEQYCVLRVGLVMIDLKSDFVSVTHTLGLHSRDPPRIDTTLSEQRQITVLRARAYKAECSCNDVVHNA